MSQFCPKVHVCCFLCEKCYENKKRLRRISPEIRLLIDRDRRLVFPSCVRICEVCVKRLDGYNRKLEEAGMKTRKYLEQHVVALVPVTNKSRKETKVDSNVRDSQIRSV